MMTCPTSSQVVKRGRAAYMRPPSLLLILLLVGCGNLNKLNNDINTSLGEMLGTSSAFVLAGSPRTSNCSDARCRALEDLEQEGYEKARSGQITWVRLVDAFYEARRTVYPNSNDSQAVYELQAFQRALAEQLDARRVTESQWSYLVEKKISELQERQRTGTTTCNTTNVGTSMSPNYRTVCR